jgi:GNAT superfamily N-acetyltransferase
LVVGDAVAVRDVDGGAGAICHAILSLLPAWFGIPEANADYVRTAETHSGVVAGVGGDDVGIATIKHHSPYAAEIYLMAVKPAYHRHGIGRLMVHRIEERLRAEGVEFVQVKTLSPAHPDEGYAKTRAFWLACGFRPLEEFPTLWDPSNPALQLIKSVPPA